MTSERFDLLPGALDMMVLKTLTEGAQHGYSIVRHIQRRCQGALSIEEGTLYPALHRMEARGWVRASWGQSDSGRKAKFYVLTPRGRKELSQRVDSWARFTGAVSQVMGDFEPTGAGQLA